MGIAASNTCPTLSPKYAAAAENKIAINIPHVTDHPFTSGYTWSGFMIGSYFSPSFNSLNALSGSPAAIFSFSSIIHISCCFCKHTQNF